MHLFKYSFSPPLPNIFYFSSFPLTLFLSYSLSSLSDHQIYPPLSCLIIFFSLSLCLSHLLFTVYLSLFLSFSFSLSSTSSYISLSILIMASHPIWTIHLHHEKAEVGWKKLWKESVETDRSSKTVFFFGDYHLNRLERTSFNRHHKWPIRDLALIIFSRINFNKCDD